MIIDVPYRDEEGNVKFTMTLNEEQLQGLLQFALAFSVAAGITSSFNIMVPEEHEQRQLDD